ncbi:MAG: DctM-like transporter [candidate division BRC1 bacterium ADurb.BinA364]|nr:MAG: DctM-like transporter [candidate division BRC1 bacterium ADurb.BinA364]
MPDSPAESERFEEEGVWRRPLGWQRFIIPSIAVAWSLFQLYEAHFAIFDSLFVRAIHLAFALLLIFLARPPLRKPRFGLQSLAGKDRIPLYDFVLGVLASASALYLLFDYRGIAMRLGAPLARDIVFGLLLVVLLLEACRRAIGPALSVVAAVFIAYAFLAPYAPGALAFKGVSLGRFIGQIAMGDEGIFGTPLRVSARTVYLFVLFGAMLDQAGGGRFFTRLALSVLGGFRGGPAKAAVVSSGLTGIVSGSSIANIVTTGTFTIPLMKRVGYPPTKAAAIEVAASTDGQLAPPIMGAAAFIIAEYVNVPYIEVVKAAAVPAFASYAALFYITHVEACKLGLKRMTRAELPGFRDALLGGLHYLLPLAALLYLLIVEQRTPESAAFAAIAAMIPILLIQPVVRARRNGDDWRSGLRAGIEDLFKALAAGARNMVAVAAATAGAGIIVGVVAMGLGGLITEAVQILSRDNTLLMLVITAFASLIIGMGLPTTATYITMASLTAPVIVTIAGHHDLAVPLMAAHLFCFYFGILADDTPPVGLAAYAAAAIAKSPPISTGIQGFLYDIRTAILPFMFIFNADLILHGIDSWPFGLMVFALACFGNFAFVAATQGWFQTRNRWWEIPFFLAVTFILMRPDQMAKWCGLPHEQRYWTAPIGLALFAALFLEQRWRMARAEKRGGGNGEIAPAS